MGQSLQNITTQESARTSTPQLLAMEEITYKRDDASLSYRYDKVLKLIFISKLISHFRGRTSRAHRILIPK